jgi:hypothetical protein
MKTILEEFDSFHYDYGIKFENNKIRKIRRIGVCKSFELSFGC